MSQLLVRGLSEDVVRRLRERAKLHRRSVEAEHRAILEEALGAQSTSRDLVAALQDIPWLGELDLAELRDNDPPREFEFDPRTGTTVNHARPAPGHDRPD
jgi:plasmid stability protein